MFRSVLFVTSLLTMSLPATAGLMTYEGSGTFDDSGSFAFSFDWDNTLNLFLDPVSATTTAGDTLTGLTTYAKRFRSQTTPVPGGFELTQVTLAATNNSYRDLRLDFAPALHPLSGIVAVIGAEVDRLNVLTAPKCNGSNEDVCRPPPLTRFIVAGSASLAPAAISAPATLALFGLGLAGLGWSRRKKV